MVLDFIGIIHSIKADLLRSKSDGAIVSYIAQSVRNAYIALIPSPNSCLEVPVSWDNLTEAQRLSIEVPEKAEEARDFFELLDTCPKLTQKERIILTLIYFYGYTSTEIAQKRGVSAGRN